MCFGNENEKEVEYERNCLREESPELEDSSPITLEEVKAALAAIDGRRAAGSDGICEGWRGCARLQVW